MALVDLDVGTLTSLTHPNLTEQLYMTELEFSINLEIKTKLQIICLRHGGMTFK